MGGTQTAWGPLIGAAFFTIVPEALREIAEMLGWHWLAEGRFLLFGAFIVVLMVLLDQTLFLILKAEVFFSF